MFPRKLQISSRVVDSDPIIFCMLGTALVEYERHRLNLGTCDVWVFSRFEERFPDPFLFVVAEVPFVDDE